MKSFLKIVGWIVLGLVLGSATNMALVMIGPILIPPPPGTDVSTMEGLKSAMALMQPKHFLFPFLAHAIGTFVGALVAAKFTSSMKAIAAMTVGIFFLLGGVANTMMLPSPTWLTVIDLTFAYIPTAWIGFIAAKKMVGTRK